jgi:copper resistance protein C
MRLLATCLALCATLALPEAALSHASVVETRPAAGAVLERSPQRVVVVYSEALGAVDEAGVRAGGREIAGAPRLDRSDRRRLIIPLGAAAPGPHRAWWVVVAADGHPQRGELAFSVRADPVLARIHALGARLVATARVIEQAARQVA